MTAIDLESEVQALLAEEEAERRERARQQVQARREQQWREETISAPLQQLESRLRTIDPTAVDKARHQLERAMEGYITAVVAYNGELDGIRDELTRAGLQNHPTVNLYKAGPFPGITVGSTSALPQPVQRTIADVAKAAIRRHFPRYAIDLNQPKD